VSRHAAGHSQPQAPRQAIYAEDRSGLSRSVLIQGILAPVTVVGSIIASTLPRLGGLVILTIAAGLWAVVMTSSLIFTWPIGIRLDAEGIRIGGLRAWERRQRSGRWPPRKPFHVGAQGRAVFTCPGPAVRSLYLLTDRAEVKTLATQLAKFRKRSAGTRMPLGFFPVTPWSGVRAVLVISNHPAFTSSDPPEFRTNWGQFGRLRGVTSPTWQVPTRHPDQLRAALKQCPWAPPVHDHLPPQADFQFYTP